MPYLVIDLEMTGPDPDFHDFIQIGAVLADDKWQLIDEFDTLVYPDNEQAFSLYAEQIHGLTIHDLYDAPTPYEAIQILENWIMEKLKYSTKKSLRSVVLAGQSIYNDLSFLRSKYFRYKLKWKFAFRLLDLSNFSYIIFKILKFNNLPYPKSYSLDSVAKFFGFERNYDEHDALEDAKLTFLCFQKFYQIMSKLEISQDEIAQILKINT